MTASRRLPLVVGTVVIAAFFATVHATRLAPTPYPVFGTSRMPWTLFFIGAILAAAYAVGLPEIPRTRLGAGGAAVVAASSGVGAVALAQTLLGTPVLPRVVLGGVWLCFVPWALLCWNAENDRAVRTRRRALFIGDPENYAEVRTEVSHAGVPVDFDGFVDLTAADRPELSSLEGDLDLVILDVLALADSEVLHHVSAAHRRGVRVRTVSLFVEEYLGKIPLGDLERVSLLFDVGELHRQRYVRAKRLIDALLAGVGVLMLLPLSVVVTAGNAVGNRGPLFYRQDRIGKDGRPFRILKFRSMSPSTASTEWTSSDDPRVTPFGSFLRRSHLDELPQVWNVFRGELSIVGPRPEQPHYVEQLESKIPFYDTRHIVRPGLTGWAQVNYPYGADEVDAREKLQYDLFYLRRQSLRLDVLILVRTIRTVIGRTGR